MHRVSKIPYHSQYHNLHPVLHQLARLTVGQTTPVGHRSSYIAIEKVSGTSLLSQPQTFH